MGLSIYLIAYFPIFLSSDILALKIAYFSFDQKRKFLVYLNRDCGPQIMTDNGRWQCAEGWKHNDLDGKILEFNAWHLKKTSRRASTGAPSPAPSGLRLSGTHTSHCNTQQPISTLAKDNEKIGRKRTCVHHCKSESSRQPGPVCVASGAMSWTRPSLCGIIM